MTTDGSIPLSPKHPSLLRTVRSWLSHALKLHSSSFEESVAELIEEHEAHGTKISSEERIMLQNLLSFGQLKVSDIMIPRTDIVAVPLECTLEELEKVLIENEHTRMPVYQGSLDNVVGFIHIKDVFPVICQKTEFILQKLLRELLFVPPSMKVLDLLIKMQTSRVHIALVLDEYGGVDGLVTIEDLVEEIVGEIEDEHDENAMSDITMIDENTIEVSARLPIEKLEKFLQHSLTHEEEGDFDTVGGFILSLVGHIPVKGEIITYNPTLDFEVTDADPRCIKRICIHKKLSEAATS